jgi:hypothetical protein
VQVKAPRDSASCNHKPEGILYHARAGSSGLERLEI